MAGTFADVPGPRLAYDADGTGIDVQNAVTGVVGSSVNPPANTAAKLNSETETPSYSRPSSAGLYVISLTFPDIRILAGYWFGHRYTTSTVPTTSPLALAETTMDGVNYAAMTVQADWANVSSPFYRSNIVRLGGIACIGARWWVNYDPAVGGYPWLHVYGASQGGQNIHRLALWHPTLDQPAGGAYLDWGDVPRGSSADRTFRIKNVSTMLTAVTPTLSVDTLDTSVSVSPAGMHLLSADGSNFAATLALPTLVPGAKSGVLTLRRSVPLSAGVGLSAARLRAVASNWT